MAPAAETPAAETAAISSALALHDDRPFFEKALIHGVRHGLITAERRAAIDRDAPKGMVQIARYFGSEFLRPELEKARDRMVNLISLYLLETTGGDLAQAAVSLRDHSFLSRSKGGSDMLKQLIALPESSNFGMGGHAEAETSLLALWSLRSHAQYRAELARRQAVQAALDAALWLAADYDLEEETLQEHGADAEAVIRTALLLAVLEPAVPLGDGWPSAPALEKALTAARKKPRWLGALAESGCAVDCPEGVPPRLKAVVQAQCAVVAADLPRLLDPTQSLRTLLRPLGPFRGRYFLLDDPLQEVDDYHRSLDALDEEHEPPAPATKTWQRATQGHEDDHSLITLFVCLAAGAPKKTLLTEKAAASLVRRVRKHGWHPQLATAFIQEHAPGRYRDDYCALWLDFAEGARATLLSDLDHHLHDALALLRRECNIVG